METRLNTITVPQLAKSIGVSRQYLYQVIADGKGPALTPHGKLSVVSLDSAIWWLERRLHRRLAPAISHRAGMERTLTDLRVQRAFLRSVQRRRQQRRKYTYVRNGLEAA